jgi:acetyl-CoA synthase
MSDVLIDLGTKGSQSLLKACRSSLEAFSGKRGPSAALGFPDTTYFLPLINGLLRKEVKTVADATSVIADIESLSLGKPSANGVSIDLLAGALNKGIASLLAMELLAAVATAQGDHPTAGSSGFIPDKILRSLGLQLVDGRIAGIAVILGSAPDDTTAAQLIRSFQSRSIVSLLAGACAGSTFKAQLERAGVAMGLENYIVPLGDDYLSAIYAVNFAVRAPLMYGGFKAGQWQGIAEYIRNRVPAFILLLGHVDEVLVGAGLGALAFGLPIVTDQAVPQVGKLDTTLYEALITEKDYKKIPSTCIMARGIKVRLAEVDIPVPYAAAFEGERVRREQMHAECGGKASEAFEFLTMQAQDSVEDGKVDVLGPDIDQLPAGASFLPLAITVQVYGRKMQKDFEPILERQIHRFVNYALGLMHVGQRDMLWLRVSKDAFAKGFRLKHVGVIIHAMLHQEYSAIVDKAQVVLYTKPDDVKRLLPQAQKAYDERDERSSGMSDEKVDTYYSCLLCQSFAPNHVCVITPERLGLCGAYSWLDAKASFEIAPTGPNKPITKGSALDENLGQWENVNEFVRQASNKTVERLSMYSLMDSPQTSCGCFESIIAIIPEANGVMVVHRDYAGMTPCGMNFTTLAGSVGGGVQTPGFLGIGKIYVLSKKFISAEGGLRRLVWMPKELKNILGERLRKRCAEIGEPDLAEKIADETNATTSEELLAFLEKVGHPALTMPPLI